MFLLLAFFLFAQVEPIEPVEIIEAIPQKEVKSGVDQTAPLTAVDSLTGVVVMFQAPDKDPDMQLSGEIKLSFDNGKTWGTGAIFSCGPPPWVRALDGKDTLCGGGVRKHLPSGTQVKTETVLNKASTLQADYVVGK